MADTVDNSLAGIEAHWDWAEIFQQARAEAWGDFVPRYERAVADGDIRTTERILSQVDARARQRATSAVQALQEFDQLLPQTGGPAPATMTGIENQPARNPTEQFIEQTPSSALGIDWGAPGASARPAPPLSEQPISDWAGLGPYVGSAESFMRNVARESTGLPAADRSARAFAEGDTLAGVGNAAIAMAPVVGGPILGAAGRGLTSQPVQAIGQHIARNAPLYGLGTAGATTLASTAQPQDMPAPSAEDRTLLGQLQAELKGWQDQLAAAQAQRKSTMDEMRAQREGTGGRGAGMGPRYKAQEEALARLDGQIEQINNSITQTNAGITQVRNRMSPEYRMELLRKQEEATRVERERRSRMTTRELASDYLGYLPAVTIPMAFIAGGALRGRALSNWNRQIETIDQRWASAVQRATTASPGSNAYRQAVREAEQHMREFEALVRQGRHAGMGQAVAAGAGLGFVQGTLPEEIDLARAALGSPLWQSLKDEVFKDLATFGSYAGRAGLSTLLGGAAAYLGGEIANITPLNRGGPTGYGPQTRAMLPLPPAANTQTQARPTAPNTPPSPPGAGTAPPANPAAGPQPLAPEVLQRRRFQEGPISGGHWIDPAAPPAPNEAWVSPRGQRMWVRDAEGNFRDDFGNLVRDSRGRLVRDPRTVRPDWRRISLVDDIMFNGYPIG